MLATLAGSEPMSIGQIASVTTMKQPTVTRILDRMEARGDVRRVTDRNDRRVTMVRITAKGTRSVDKLIPLASEHADRVMAPFGQERAAELTSMLRQIIAMHREAKGAGAPRCTDTKAGQEGGSNKKGP